MNAEEFPDAEAERSDPGHSVEGAPRQGPQGQVAPAVGQFMCGKQALHKSREVVLLAVDIACMHSERVCVQPSLSVCLSVSPSLPPSVGRSGPVRSGPVRSPPLSLSLSVCLSVCLCLSLCLKIHV